MVVMGPGFLCVLMDCILRAQGSRLHYLVGQ